MPIPSQPTASDLWGLFRLGVGIELFLLALGAVAPLGGISLSISPLARAWPVLLAPARFFFGGALVDGSVPPSRGWPELALFSLLLVGAACLAALAVVRSVRIVRADRRMLALVLGGAFVLGVTLLLLPALPSDDVFSYILYGRIAAVHHANPLVAVPADYPHDPFLTLVFWRNTRSVYGPVWLLLSQALALVAQKAGGGLVAYVLLFKLLGFASHLANTLLIWAILGVLAPRRQVMGTLLYAWNPLCLLEFCASAHNDAVMLTFLLLAIYCLVRAYAVPLPAPSSGNHQRFRSPSPLRQRFQSLLPESRHFHVATGERQGIQSPSPVRRQFIAANAASIRRRFAAAANSSSRRLAWEQAGLVSLGLSISVKYVPLALFPFYLALIWRWLASAGLTRGQLARALAWRVALVAGVMVLVAIPYWAGPRTLGALLYSPPAQSLDNSLAEAISWPLRWLTQGLLGLSASGARTLVDTLLKAVTLSLFLVLWLREFRRARDLEGMLAAWGWVLVWYALVASGWFWPWYVTWAVAVVALAPWGVLTRVTLLLAGGALALYAFLPLQSAPFYGDRSVVVFGPALAYSLWEVRARWLAGERTALGTLVPRLRLALGRLALRDMS